MTAHELIARLPAQEAAGVAAWLLENDRAAYKNCVSLLAARRRLRPVFVERKPKSERNLWIAEALGKPANADLALEILQTWTLGANGKMVCEFLDSLGVAHDGKGLIEQLPEEPTAERVLAAVESLLANHPPVNVLVYLHLFTSMEMTEWPHLKHLVSTDPRLCPSPTKP